MSLTEEPPVGTVVMDGADQAWQRVRETKTPWRHDAAMCSWATLRDSGPITLLIPDPRTNTRNFPELSALAIALEGECDPRREPERGVRLEGVLDDMTDEQLDTLRLACQALESAACAAQIRNFGLKPMSST